MKKCAGICIVFVAICLLGATPEQNKSAEIFRTLKFQEVKAKETGAPVEFTVTDDTINNLKQLQSKARTISVAGDGTITIKTKDWTYDKAPSK